MDGLFSEIIIKANAKAKERKKKRRSKAKTLWLNAIKRGPLIKEIITLYGLKYKKTQNGICAIHGKTCVPLNGCAYHLLSQAEYPLMRLMPGNIVFTCRGANLDENRHRGKYSAKFGKHRQIFGDEFMDKLEILARHYQVNPMESPSKKSIPELIKMRDELNLEIYEQTEEK